MNCPCLAFQMTCRPPPVCMLQVNEATVQDTWSAGCAAHFRKCDQRCNWLDGLHGLCCFVLRILHWCTVHVQDRGACAWPSGWTACKLQAWFEGCCSQCYQCSEQHSGTRLYGVFKDVAVVRSSPMLMLLASSMQPPFCKSGRPSPAKMLSLVGISRSSRCLRRALVRSHGSDLRRTWHQTACMSQALKRQTRLRVDQRAS